MHNKWRLLAAVALGTLWFGVLADGQPPAAGLRKLTIADAVRMDMVQASIVSGRIVVKVLRPRSAPFEVSTAAGSESLVLRLSGGESLVKYQKSSPEEEISFEISGKRVRLLRLGRGGGSSLVPVEFQQPAEGMLSLTTGNGPQRRVYVAEGLWHLWFAEPEVCRQHVAPLLAMINGDWDLPAFGAEIERALTEMAGSQAAPDRRRWAALVAQLGSERFSQREAADRQLRSFGRMVASYLEHLDPARLDAEQRLRIRRILRSVSSDQADESPEQVAAALAGDPAVWLALLARESESTRRLALERLSRLLDEPIAFDPAADARTRQTQLEQLRARILKK